MTIVTTPMSASSFVVRVSPAQPDTDLRAWCASNPERIEGLLAEHGVVLFRGFPVAPADLGAVAAAAAPSSMATIHQRLMVLGFVSAAVQRDQGLKLRAEHAPAEVRGQLVPRSGQRSRGRRARADQGVREHGGDRQPDPPDDEAHRRRASLALVLLPQALEHADAAQRLVCAAAGM